MNNDHDERYASNWLAAADGLIDRSPIGFRAHRTRRWPPLATLAASDADVSASGMYDATRVTGNSRR
jgi:hypothetical protein